MGSGIKKTIKIDQREISTTSNFQKGNFQWWIFSRGKLLKVETYKEEEQGKTSKGRNVQRGSTKDNFWRR